MNRRNQSIEMKKFHVLLDSCVLFPMYLRDTLLRAAETELYLPLWSQEILNGVTRNFVSTGKMPNLSSFTDMIRSDDWLAT